MKSFTLVLLAAAASLTSAVPAATVTPAPTKVCPTACPIVTSTIHPGYRCEAGSTETLGCPVARCVVPTTTITTSTTYTLPCIPKTTTLTGGLEGGFPCPTTCPVLCPLPTVTSTILDKSCLTSAV